MNDLVPSGTIREEAPKKVEGEPVFAPLCVWCGAEWSEENVELESWSSGYCSTCGGGGEISVKITCHDCGKLMYQKDGYY